MVNPGLTETDIVRFQDLVRETSGIEIPETRRTDLVQAIEQALTETGLPDAQALLRLLYDKGAARRRPVLDHLISALTVGETHFFRNRPQFEMLATHILPELIARRGSERRLRIWSAGCSSGEEAYSLAILLDQQLPHVAAWDVLLLATDINHRALEKARRGLYGPWSFREVPAAVQADYFIRHGRDCEVLPRLRHRVTFAYLNVVEDAYPSLLTNTAALDLILFRNVLIYFSQATAETVLGRMHAALADNGWLVVGHADPSPASLQPFAVRYFPGALAYQKQAAQPVPAPDQMALAGTAPQSSQPGAPAWVANPSLPPAGLDLARTLWRQGRPDDALPLLQELAEAHPGEVQAAYLAARIEASRLRLDAAQAWLGLVLQRDALFAPAHYLQGLILQEMRQVEAALTAFRRSVYADPQLVLGHFALASLLASQGEAARAQRALDTVERLLAGRLRTERLAEGEGMTVGRLLELVAVHKGLR